eukprot:g19115.t1
MRRNFFSQRVANMWNPLPQKVMEAKSLSLFKKETDRFLLSKGIKGYGEKAGDLGADPLTVLLQYRTGIVNLHFGLKSFEVGHENTTVELRDHSNQRKPLSRS